MGRNFDTHRSRGGGGSQFSQTLSLGVVAALAAAAVYYAKLQYERSLRDDEERRAEEKNRKLGKLPPKTPRGGAAGKEQTPQASNVSVASSKKSEARAKARSDSPNKRSPEELSLHAKIEEIDKRGKALFKAKQYLEAAVAFTEALDLIEQAGDSTLSNSLIRQVVTLTNNRSAMYEKGQMPDLALVDCDAILELELGHVKARTRRLRILESQQKWHEALMEVCALQLKFMQDNRDKLRQGIPVGNPPVAQSKIEQLMTSVLPGEIEAVEAQQKERDNANNKGGQRPLPSNYTILQLLKSFGGYNQWMGQAARDGSVESFSKQLDESSTPNAERAVLLWKRGRRHAYDGKFDVAKDDFDAASDLLEDDTIKAELQDGTSGDNYARILEWAGMAKHLTYNLDGALKYYEECSDIEPTNAELLVKRAGVKTDGGKYDDALELFETALGLDPDAVDAYLHRANLRLMQGDPVKARADLERCLELRPNHLLARLRLATVLMATNDLEGAKRCLDFAERVDPDSSEVHSYRGEMHFAQGDYAAARVEFDKATKCEPTNPAPYVNAALAVMNTPPAAGETIPDVNEAIRLLEKSIEIDPQFHSAYVHLGQLKLSMATDLVSARDVIQLYDKGLMFCRTTEELKDICSMRILAVAQVDAATALGMETLNMQ